MKKGIITNRWNLVQGGRIVAQCFADTLYEANIYFENADLDMESKVFAKCKTADLEYDFEEIEIDKTFNTKER